MQLYEVTHSKTGGLYTRTEYDDIRLGEWRVVWSYDPIRHCYVRDVAAPILAAQGVPVDDPDAAIAPVLPATPADAKPPVAPQHLAAYRRNEVLRERIAEMLRERPQTVREIAAELGFREQRPIALLLHNHRRFERRGYVVFSNKRMTVWGVAE